MTKKVRMLKDLNELKKGTEVNTSEKSAENMIKEGFAELVKDETTIVDLFDEKIRERDEKLKTETKTSEKDKCVKFDYNNRYYKHLKLLCTRKDKEKKGLFHNSKKVLFDSLLKNYEKILKEDKIILDEIIPKKEQQWMLELLLPRNKNAFLEDTTRLTPDYEKPLIDTIKSMYEMQNSINSSSVIDDSRDMFKGIDPKDDDDSFYPRRDFTSSDFMLNAMLDNEIEYVFNPLILEDKLEKTQETITTMKINLNSFVGVREIITKKKAICTAKSKEGFECGNVVHFNDIHETSVIKCTDSLPDSKRKSDFAGHSIKNISSKSIVEESLTLFMYQGKTENLENDILVFSPFRIESKFIECNIVRLGFGDSLGMNIIIAINENNSSEKNLLPEGEVIFCRDKTKFDDWTDAAFDGCKKYCKKYMKIDIKNRGKVVGIVYIQQLVYNENFDLATKSMIIGSSGIGKSFYNKVLVPLFTSSYTTVYGNEVTRTRLLGGQPSKEDMKVMGSYVPGLVATHNFICFEESTNALDEMFKNQNSFKDGFTRNIFTMMKGLDNKFDTYNIAIQGGKESTFIASTAVLGNSENLSSIQADYTNKVSKAYGFNTKPLFKKSWDIHRPISYYLNELGNEKLAKAHEMVRDELLPMDYMTYLPEAEQGRYDWKYFLIEKKNGFPEEINERVTMKDIETVHRTQYNMELKRIFGEEVLPQKVWLNTKLGKSVKELLLKHIRGPNNFVFTNRNYNNQLLTNIHRISTAFIMANRLWFNEGITRRQACSSELDDKEKLLLTDKHWRYNYNTLDNKEAEMSKKPEFQSFIFDSDRIYNEKMELLEEQKKNKGINVELDDDDPFKSLGDRNG